MVVCFLFITLNIGMHKQTLAHVNMQGSQRQCTYITHFLVTEEVPLPLSVIVAFTSSLLHLVFLYTVFLPFSRIWRRSS